MTKNGQNLSNYLGKMAKKEAKNSGKIANFKTENSGKISGKFTKNLHKSIMSLAALYNKNAKL